jgi:hypothetical protein
MEVPSKKQWPGWFLNPQVLYVLEMVALRAIKVTTDPRIADFYQLITSSLVSTGRYLAASKLF